MLPTILITLTAIVLSLLTISHKRKSWSPRGPRYYRRVGNEFHPFGDVIELPAAARMAGGRAQRRSSQQRTDHDRTHDELASRP